MTSEMITIGKIVASFGIKGEVKVYPYSDFLDRVFLLKKVLLEKKEFRGSRIIKKAFIHKNIWIMHFEGCDSRDDADGLIGTMIKIPASERVPLPKGSYYFDQIIGLKAITVDGEKLGIVDEILKPGGNDVYVINPGEGQGDDVIKKKIMLPALKTVIREINPEEGYMLVELPPGLLNL